MYWNGRDFFCCSFRFILKFISSGGKMAREIHTHRYIHTHTHIHLYLKHTHDKKKLLLRANRIKIIKLMPFLNRFVCIMFNKLQSRCSFWFYSVKKNGSDQFLSLLLLRLCIRVLPNVIHIDCGRLFDRNARRVFN